MISATRRFFLENWQKISIYLIGIVYLLVLLFFRNEQLHPSLTPAELATQSPTLHSILYSVVNGPYKVINYAIIYLSPNHNHLDIFELRSFTVIIGFLMMLAFFSVLKHRYTSFIALSGTLLFATSTWILNITRLATPEILLCGSIFLVWAGQFAQKTKHDRIAAAVLVCVASIFLYTPGFIFIIALEFIWMRKFLINLFRSLPAWLKACLIVISLALVFPILWGGIHDPRQLALLAGFQTHLSSPSVYLKNFYELPINLFYKGPSNPIIWLGRLPIFDVFEIVLLILGAYMIWQNKKLEYSRLISAILVIGWALVTLGGDVTLSILIPILYLVIAIGLSELLSQWYEIFPRNPLARTVGLSLLSVAILLSCYYQTARYFVAWPDSPTIKNTQNVQ